MSDVHRWTTAGGIAVVAAADHDAEIESLRSRLAAADALLREIGDDLKIGAHPQLYADRIDAHLAGEGEKHE